MKGKRRIIIIGTKDDKKFFDNPSICQKILGDSIFGEMKIEEIDLRGIGRSIKFEINAEDVVDKNLERITKIGSYYVSVRPPLLDSHLVGVIGCFNKEVDLITVVLPHLKVIKSSSKIIELRRILIKKTRQNK